jgi:hypothetical protein
MTTITTDHFDRQYQSHLKHLKLKGLQPKTIDAYAFAIRRIGARFEHRIDCLTEDQLAVHENIDARRLDSTECLR